MISFSLDAADLDRIGRVEMGTVTVASSCPDWITVKTADSENTSDRHRLGKRMAES